MAANTDALTDGSGSNHPAAELETIVVDPEDVLEMMKRNYRDEHQQHTHVLRVTPPLKGERKAELYVSDDHAYYPPDISAEPIHLGADDLLNLRVNNHLHHPDHTVERSLFRDEYDLSGTEELPEDEWDEWWQTVVEVWESDVRAAMHEPVEIELGGTVPEYPATTVEVRFEDDE